MSISTLESPASQRALAATFAQSDEIARAERGLAEAFERAARRGDVNAPAALIDEQKPFGEILLDAFEWLPREEQIRVLGVLCKTAWSNEAQTAQARVSVNKMAWLWASQNAVAE